MGRVEQLYGRRIVGAGGLAGVIEGRIMNSSRFWLAVLIAAVPATPTEAQINVNQGAAEFSLSVGYANVDLNRSSVINDEGALRIGPSVTFSPIAQLPQLRIGGDVGVVMVLENSTRTIISNDGGLIFIGSSEIPFWVIEPEASISFRQPLGARHEFFVEPGVAGGYAFGFLDLDALDTSGDSYDADDSTPFARAFLRIGMEVVGGTAGVEVSWAEGQNMDFGGNASGDFSEFYLGFFGALRF
jgi:hypothetical protein